MALALLATTAAVLWTLARWQASHGRATGDGRNAESYGFVLDPLLVTRATLAASGMSKDGLRSPVDPKAWTLADLASYTAKHRGKLLVDSDRVVGVVSGGEARAYPLRFLTWHEAVNDTLGGLPIAITYHPLCDSVVVFPRQVGGQVRVFGVSGLLSESNQLLYDRQPDPAGESLWSQLRLRAISGPAARTGLTLTPLPFALTTWRRWCELHPETTVLAPVAEMVKDYRRSPYASYFGSDLLRFPVSVRRLPADLPNKTPVAVVLVDGEPHVFQLPLRWQGQTPGPRAIAIGSRRLLIDTGDGAGTVRVTDESGATPPLIHAFLFAWQAAQGNEAPWHPLDGS